MKCVLLSLLLVLPLTMQAQLIGTAYTAGTTRCSFQHDGSAGKMISTDDAANVHVVWSNALDGDLCHVFYNVWNPFTDEFSFNGGVQVNASQQADGVCQATNPDGFCFPAFSNIINFVDGSHTAAAIDFLPGLGNFTVAEPSYLRENSEDLKIFRPKICLGSNGDLHAVSMEDPSEGPGGNSSRLYYSRGVPIFDGEYGIEVDWQTVAPGGAEFMLVDTTMTYAADIAASPSSGRVVIVWAKNRDDMSGYPEPHNNDLYMMISEDGGINWEPPINVTDFIAPDADCQGGNTRLCNNDTLRVYHDASVIFDMADHIHVAFTTIHYFEYEYALDSCYSDIWHWGEDTGEFSLVARAQYTAPDWCHGPGEEQRAVQRPSLSVDRTSGHLYCSYQQFVPTTHSHMGYAMADACVTGSTDNGSSWAVGTNVTGTTPSAVPVAEGESEHEAAITLADHVAYEEGAGFLYMEYVFVREPYAGSQTGPVNSVILQRIPVDEIASAPLMPDAPFHVEHAAAAEEAALETPNAFALHQNYPNPFNAVTNIVFDLPKVERVSLKIFDVTGREVTTLADERFSAGSHTMGFNAEGLSSGVYFCRLQAGSFAESRKIILLK